MTPECASPPASTPAERLTAYFPARTIELLEIHPRECTRRRAIGLETSVTRNFDTAARTSIIRSSQMILLCFWKTLLLLFFFFAFYNSYDSRKFLPIILKLGTNKIIYYWLFIITIIHRSKPLSREIPLQDYIICQITEAEFDQRCTNKYLSGTKKYSFISNKSINNLNIHLFRRRELNKYIFWVHNTIVTEFWYRI